MPTTVVDIIERTVKIEEASLVMVDPSRKGEDFDLSGPWLLPDNLALAKAVLAHSGVGLTGIGRAIWPGRY